MLERDRARFLEEAVAHAAALRQGALAAPPPWNRPTGDADVDALVWFRYVETEGLEPTSPSLDEAREEARRPRPG